jgi:transposase
MFTLTALAPREAEMRIIECDLRARQQTLAILDTTTGEVEEKMLMPEGENVLEFCSPLPKPGCVGIEATGSMSWFVKLLEELGIECRVGDPSQIWVGRAPEEET